jgi:hypothetical protein
MGHKEIQLAAGGYLIRELVKEVRGRKLEGEDRISNCGFQQKDKPRLKSET